MASYFSASINRPPKTAPDDELELLDDEEQQDEVDELDEELVLPELDDDELLELDDELDKELEDELLLAPSLVVVPPQAKSAKDSISIDHDLRLDKEDIKKGEETIAIILGLFP